MDDPRRQPVRRITEEDFPTPPFSWWVKALGKGFIAALWFGFVVGTTAAVTLYFLNHLTAGI